jgi:hypothetical protein
MIYDCRLLIGGKFNPKINNQQSGNRGRRFKMGEKKGFKVKTFTTELKIFQTMKELETLDNQVNRFIIENGVKKLVSVTDTATTDNTGATIGLIRVVGYEI